MSANSEITKAQKNLEFNANTTVLNDVISDSPFPEYESKYVVHLESNQTLHLKNIDFQRDNGIKNLRILAGMDGNSPASADRLNYFSVSRFDVIGETSPITSGTKVTYYAGVGNKIETSQLYEIKSKEYGFNDGKEGEIVTREEMINATGGKEPICLVVGVDWWIYSF